MQRNLILLAMSATMGMLGCTKQPEEDLAGLYPPEAVDLDTMADASDPLGPVTGTFSSTPAPGGAMSEAQTYTIQRRDTLWSIAKRYYGDGKRWHDIAAANPGIIPERLKIGQTIVMP